MTFEGRRALDAEGIERWLIEGLRRLASKANIGAVIPIGHGAAVAIIHEGTLLFPPLDYEEPIPSEIRAAYDRKRDPFSRTGSPALPDGLNLGVQLFRVKDALLGDTQILLWPQYWAWKLSGVAAAEVTSLGCHTDLWCPRDDCFSELARSMGWAERFPPLRYAGDVLGTVTAEWADRTGLPQDTQVHCGVHDSNAALVAARAYPEIRNKEATVLSTGTWFVAMRSPARDTTLPSLSEDRDCLLNVDVHRHPIPSARFMGGRELELLAPAEQDPHSEEPQAMLAAVPQILQSGAMTIPSFVAGVGPFPHNHGRWINKPDDAITQHAASYLYAAMVASASLDLIGAKERILIEGRFAQVELFVRALAALRPQDAIYTSSSVADVSFGAICLLNASIQPPALLRRVDPLPHDLDDYHEAWKRKVNQDTDE